MLEVFICLMADTLEAVILENFKQLDFVRYQTSIESLM